MKQKTDWSKYFKKEKPKIDWQLYMDFQNGIMADLEKQEERLLQQSQMPQLQGGSTVS